MRNFVGSVFYLRSIPVCAQTNCTAAVGQLLGNARSSHVDVVDLDSIHVSDLFYQTDSVALIRYVSVAGRYTWYFTDVQN